MIRFKQFNESFVKGNFKKSQFRVFVDQQRADVVNKITYKGRLVNAFNVAGDSFWEYDKDRKVYFQGRRNNITGTLFIKTWNDIPDKITHAHFQ